MAGTGTGKGATVRHQQARSLLPVFVGVLLRISRAGAEAFATPASGFSHRSLQQRSSGLNMQQDGFDEARKRLLSGGSHDNTAKHASAPEIEEEAAPKSGHFAPMVNVRGGQQYNSPVPRSLWARYQDELSLRPLRTKMITSGAIALLGDLISQLTTQSAIGAPAVDLRRLALYGLVGLTYVPVAIHYWFDWLDRLSNSRPVAKRVHGKYPSALFMLSLDQTIGTVVMNAGFFVVHTFLTYLVAGQLFPLGHVASVAEGKLRRELWPVMLMNWRIWPLANFINFSMVPKELRVLFANVVAIFWNAFLSAKVNT